MGSKGKGGVELHLFKAQCTLCVVIGVSNSSAMEGNSTLTLFIILHIIFYGRNLNDTISYISMNKMMITYKLY